MPIYAYCRIPSHTQTTDAKRRSIERYCLASGIREYELYEDAADTHTGLDSKNLYRLLDRLRRGDTFILCRDDVSSLPAAEMQMIQKTSRVFDIKIVSI